MKKVKKPPILEKVTVQNPVAKFAHQFNKALVFKDKTLYSRKTKHKTEEVSPIIPANTKGVLGKPLFLT